MLKTDVTIARAEIGQTFDDTEFCVVTFTANIFGFLGTTWEEPMFRRRTQHAYQEYVRWAYLDSGVHVNADMDRAINAHLKLESAHD